MKTERLYSIILGVHTTEKTVQSSQGVNQVVFKVRPDATKAELKIAIEKLFAVRVLAVQTLNMEGKKKYFKQRLGKRSNFKKAMVRLAEGQVVQVENFE